jgi:hypothetical protein
MKIRFLAFLAAVAVGSAAVLIYAAQNKEKSSASLSGAEDCSACEMSATKPAVAATVKSTDGCCLSQDATAVATTDTAGCSSSEASALANAKVMADVETPKAANGACCASEGANPSATTVAKE